MSSTPGPVEVVLAAEVARRYFLDAQSKVDIAAALDISRFKVARLLESARANGIVRIEIVNSFGVQSEVSVQLREKYSLKHCVVVDSGDQDPHIREIVGRAAARLLSETLTPDDVLGLPWARTVSSMVDTLDELPCLRVVQLTGSLVIPDEGSPVDMVRIASRIAGGPAHYFYAPLVLDDAESASQMRRQPEVAAAFDHVKDVTVEVVGIGRWVSGQSTIYDAATPAERHEADRLGAVGEVMGLLFDRNGTPLDASISRRLMTIDWAALRAVPDTLALVTGREKLPAVRAALAGGLVTSLVTDATVGRALLDESPSPTHE